MYVQCERCQAEYEFDDALVSERGTTVKCTSCGHQFKIRRAGVTSGEGDRWVVKTEGGQEHIFSSLKELQRAIIAKTVSRNDQLSRSGSAPKALASIAELEPFFEERRLRNPSVPDHRPALATSTRPPPPLPPGASHAPPRAPMRSDPARSGSRPSMPPPVPPPRTTTTVRPASAVPPPPAGNGGNSGRPPEPKITHSEPPADAKGPWSGDDTPTHAIRRDPPVSLPPVQKKPSLPAGASKGPPRPPPPHREEAPSMPEVSSPLPPDPARISASDQLRGRPSYIDAPHSHPSRKRVGGWVVGVALVAGVAAVGIFMSKRGPATTTPTTATKLDARAQQFLTAGEAALSQGNLELAKENLDKASALSESSPEVLLASARLAAARADLAWLRYKLLPPESDDARLARQSLEDLAAAARRSADAAQKGAPEDIALVRARIDAMRMAGEISGARALVDRILPTGSQPETAYVLAALDLSESDPPWSVVISRLRAAAAGEGAASRARAALVYALARSGDVAEARKELERLVAQPRVHPLLASLRSFVERAGESAKDGGAPKPADSLATSIDISKLPSNPQATPPQVGTPDRPPVTPATPPATPATPPNTNGTNGTGSTPIAVGNLPSDPRTLIRLAEQAKAKKDLPRARTLYEAALAKSPSDSEALGGMADVMRAQGDTAGAQAAYKKALGVNPSYLPALIALADMAWDGGDKGAAQRAYRDIVDRFPEPAYPARVKQRAEGTAP